MSFIFTQTAQLYFLQTLINSDILLLHLFSNDWTPSKTDVIGSYTELVFSGYAPKLLVSADWTYTIDPLTTNYVASFPKQTFTFDDITTAFGYYITNHAGNKLLAAERFPTAPITLLEGFGGTIKITPVLGSK